MFVTPQNGTIWGLTAFIVQPLLHQLFQPVLLPEYDHDHHHHPAAEHVTTTTTTTTPGTCATTMATRMAVQDDEG